MAEADAEDGYFSEQLLYGFDGVADRGGVAWAVAQEDAVGFGG